jgi:hypothetical protein
MGTLTDFGLGQTKHAMGEWKLRQGEPLPPCRMCNDDGMTRDGYSCPECAMGLFHAMMGGLGKA